MTHYKKLNNDPLVLVLAEVRYSPILNINKYLPELQDVLRHQFPKVEKASEKAFHLSEDGMKVSDIERWLFKSKDSSQIVDVDQNRVIFSTTHYDRFDGFKRSVEVITDAVQKVINPSLFTRIGLRYCDTIYETEQHKLSELVNPQLLLNNAYHNLGARVFNRQETLIQAESTHLVIRSMQAVTTLTAPEDISRGSPMSIQDSEESSLRLLLDFDHFWQDEQEPCDFNVKEVLQKLESLHELSREAFWDVTTEYAREKVWL